MTLAGLVLAALYSPSLFCGNPGAPNLSADCAILIDAKSGRLLYGKNVDKPCYPASTTKIMTGLLLAENTSPTDLLIAPPEVDKVRGSSLHLKPGEILSANDMLLGLMMRSANDGAHTIAVKLAGSDEAFASMMNKRAKEIGCENTQFYTPHGLNHPYHMTTASDMAKIAMIAIRNPRFAAAVSMPKVTLTRSINTLDQLVKNTNTLLEQFSAIKGIKTGYTNPAGQCFVGYVSDSDREFISVIFQSKNWKSDQKQLSTWALSQYSYRPVVPMEASLFVPVVNGQEELFSAKTVGRERAMLSDWDIHSAQLKFSQSQFRAPIESGQRVSPGIMTLTDGTAYRVELVATSDVQKKPDFSLLGFSLLAAVSGVTYWMKARARKSRFTSQL